MHTNNMYYSAFQKTVYLCFSMYSINFLLHNGICTWQIKEQRIREGVSFHIVYIQRHFMNNFRLNRSYNFKMANTFRLYLL